MPAIVKFPSGLVQLDDDLKWSPLTAPVDFVAALDALFDVPDDGYDPDPVRSVAERAAQRLRGQVIYVDDPAPPEDGPETIY